MSSESTAPKKQPKPSWDPFIKEVLIFFAIAIVLRIFTFEPFHIPSGSMKSNLLVGDYLFVSKYSYGYSRYSFPFGMALPFHGRFAQFGAPQRGDVVVFRPPGNLSLDFIKRVMGLPGDRVQVKQGVVYINDKPLPRELEDHFADDDNPAHVKSVPRYRETLPEGKVIRVLQETTEMAVDNTDVYIVPPGHYFMMGDNRDNSHDSRSLADVGYVPAENIVGKAQMVMFSVEFDNSPQCTGEWNAQAPDGWMARNLFYVGRTWECLPKLRGSRAFAWIK